MNFEEHLPTAHPKIQAGASIQIARKQGREFLSKHIQGAQLDVDVLMESACNLSRLELVTSLDRILSAKEALRFNEFLARRARAEPVAYILQEKEFFGLPFFVDPSVLIPRPDTELLVEEAVKIIGAHPVKVIDVCTGSGCIALSIAKNCELAQVVAIDICNNALKVASKNASRLSLEDRVIFSQGNLLNDISLADVDLIVANPPYIFPHEMPFLMKDVRDFEPGLALVGKDEDGLGLHRELLSQSFAILRPGATLMMEIGHSQAKLLSEMPHVGFSSPEFLKDYSGIMRVVKYRRLPLSSSEEVL